eukprot:RCo048024
MSDPESQSIFLESTLWALVSAGVASGIAIGISLRTVDRHIRWNPHSEIRAYLVRVLFMVPVYAAAAWLALAQRSYARFWNMFRGIYEAITVYSFFMFMVSYLGGPAQVVHAVEDRMRSGTGHPIHQVCFLRLCRKGTVDPAAFVRQATLGVLQYVPVVVVLAVLELFLEELGLYRPGDWSADENGFPFCTVVEVLSVTVAMVHLIWFYHNMKEELAGCWPLPKLLCIKGVVFLTFFQGMLIGILVKAGVIQPQGHYTAGDVATALQFYILCWEMLVFAGLQAHYYPYNEYDGMMTSEHKGTAGDRDTPSPLTAPLPLEMLTPETVAVDAV